MTPNPTDLPTDPDDGCSKADPEPSSPGTALEVIRAVAGLPAVPELPQVDLVDLYAALLADAAQATTRRARANDIADLGRYMGTTDPRAACMALCGAKSGQANAIAAAYRAALLAEGEAPATINRKLSTLRKLTRLARRYGLIDWTIEVDSLKSQAYRDTSGPGRSGWLRMEEAARKATRSIPGRWTDGAAQQTARATAARNYAILLLLYDVGLRRGEVSSIDVEDWHPDSAKLHVRRKGRGEKSVKDLPGARTCAALEEWLELRGREPGPMFVQLDHAAGSSLRSHRRLSGNGIWEVVRSISKAAGLKTPARPHGIRHQAITRAAELTNGNILDVQQFADHADPKTTMIYIDRLKNTPSKVSKMLSQDG